MSDALSAQVVDALEELQHHQGALPAARRGLFQVLSQCAWVAVTQKKTLLSRMHSRARLQDFHVSVSFQRCVSCAATAHSNQTFLSALREQQQHSTRKTHGGFYCEVIAGNEIQLSFL